MRLDDGLADDDKFNIEFTASYLIMHYRIHKLVHPRIIHGGVRLIKLDPDGICKYHPRGSNRPTGCIPPPPISVLEYPTQIIIPDIVDHRG